MKNNHYMSKCIIVCLELYFLTSAVYLYQNVLPSVAENSVKDIINFLIIQNVISAVLALTVFLCMVIQNRKKAFASPFQSLKIMSGAGKLKEEVSLLDRQSFFIAGNGQHEILVNHIETVDTGQMEYAVLNLVSGYWYIEAISGQYPVGLRKENEGVVYKLKPAIPYKLSARDMIYVDANKILIN